jgi:hypothetical protein
MWKARPLAPDELDHELIWLAVSLLALVFGAAWIFAGGPRPVCGIRALTGFPCVSCGATRCFAALLRGNLTAALAANPAVFVGFTMIAVFDLYAVVVLAFRWRRIRWESRTPAVMRRVRYACLALLGLNWIYVLTRDTFPL